MLQPAPHHSAKLDVLIPHYRDPAGLAASLASVAAQDWLAHPHHRAGNRLRVVLVDDGSPPAEQEAARAALESFAATSGQAVLFDALPANQGRPAARNRLLDLARAPYLAWLDAGDLWYPAKLSVQCAHLAALTAAGADPARLWVSCAYDLDQDGRRMALHQQVAGDQLRNLLTGEGLRAYLWTMLGRAEAFALAGRFDEGLPRLQDLDHALAFLRAGGRITVPPATGPDPEPLCRYVKSHLGRDAAQIAACYQLVLKRAEPETRGWPGAARRAAAHKAWMLPARCALANGQHRAALGYLLRAGLASPGAGLKIAAGLVGRRLARLAP